MSGILNRSEDLPMFSSFDTPDQMASLKDCTTLPFPTKLFEKPCTCCYWVLSVF